MIAPQTRTDNLVDEMNGFLGSGETPCEFDLARWERDAKALTANYKTAVEGYMLLGMIAAFKFDFESTHTHFRQALKLDGHDDIVASNYILAFSNAFRTHEAMEIGEELICRFDHEVEAVNSAFARVLAEAGMFIRAREYFMRLPSDQPLPVLGSISPFVVDQMADRMSRMNINERAFSEIIFGVETLLRDKFERPMVCVEAGEWSADAASINYRMNISVEDAVDINFEIADYLASTFDDPLTNFATISVVPYAN